MKKRHIEVSIIMPCHNSSAYLDEAIRSVLNQTFSDYELILVDDCSTDGTLEIAERYRQQDDRIVVLALTENSGPAIARNTGISAASGTWLGMLDSDDVAAPSRFEEQMRLASSDRDLVMVGSNSLSIDGNGLEIKRHRYPTSHGALSRRLETMRAFPPHSSLIYKRTVVQDISAFNARYVRAQDYDLWLRLAEIGKLASVDRPLVKIRKHAQNISNSEGGMQQARLAIAACVCHHLRLHQYPDPSTGNDESGWLKFLQWVDARLVEADFFEKLKARAEARAEFFDYENKLIGAVRFAGKLLASKHSKIIVSEKLRGTSLPKRLCHEWVT